MRQSKVHAHACLAWQDWFDWIRSSGWVESWEGLLLVTFILVSWIRDWLIRVNLGFNSSPNHKESLKYGESRIFGSLLELSALLQVDKLGFRFFARIKCIITSWHARPHLSLWNYNFQFYEVTFIPLLPSVKKDCKPSRLCWIIITFTDLILNRSTFPRRAIWKF